ncbi:hypothetical protein GCM10009839_34730 [Catenulispora yoronensis]|uniref:Uncharacterized protein n=1 Tax=Catenulispora yoronensis TaxID=450799 RepID=A0ABP5FUH7_9ACTN
MCGTPTGDTGTGRPRLYCSAACRQRAYRARTWQGTPRQTIVLRNRAAHLACALINKAACLHVLLNEPEPGVVRASASALTEAALDHARELLQVLERR